MSNYTELKQAIEEVIKTNGQKEITGAILQGVLTGIVSEIGANSTFAGIATPDTAPGNPDANIFYIASVPGKYVNFGDIEVTDQVIILDNSKGYWRATPANIPNGAKPPITPIEWTSESNINNYTEPGLYICTNGIRTNANDNLPINNIGENAGIGFILLVTEASSYENNNIYTRRGQTIILTNRLGNETKQYSRTQFYEINNAVTPPENSRNEWTLWQETQGTTFLGQVTKQQLDSIIDNGIYTGVTADAELMPAGSTFTLIVINNYAVNSAVGMPSIARQVSQTFIYLPLADVSTGTIKTQNGQILQRTGVGGEVINWGETSQIVERKINYEYYNFSSPTGIFNINTQSTRKLVVVHSERTDGIRIKADVSWLKIGETVNFEIVDTIFTYTDQITFNGKDVYNIFEWNSGGGVLNSKVLHAYISITRKSMTEGEMLCHCVGAFTTLNPITVTI